MLAFQERVVVEKQELDKKIDALSVFMDGGIFQTVPPAEQARLHWQRTAMRSYSDALGERIAAFQ